MPIHTTGTAASQIVRQQAASYSSQSGSCRDTPDSQPSQQLIDLSKPFLAVQILQCSVSGFLAILTPLICNLTCRLLLGKPPRQAPRPPAFWPARKPLPQLPRPCPSYAEQPCLLRASGPASLHAAKQSASPPPDAPQLHQKRAAPMGPPAYELTCQSRVNPAAVNVLPACPWPMPVHAFSFAAFQRPAPQSGGSFRGSHHIACSTLPGCAPSPPSGAG